MSAATSPQIWVVEDEARQRTLMSRMFTAMYKDAYVGPFADADAALLALAGAGSPASPLPDLLIVDLAIPSGRAGLSGLPGVDVVRQAQSRSPHIRIIVRTGLQEDVLPPGLLDERTQLLKKGDSPEAFLNLGSSFLALAGFHVPRLPVFLTPSMPVASGAEWLSTGVVLAAIPAGTSLWVASMLQVTSVHGPVFAAAMIALGIVAGGLISGSKIVGYRSQIGMFMGICGASLAIVAGLILPPIA